MAQGVRWQGPRHHAAGRPARGVRPGRCSPAGRLLRRHPRGPHHPAVGNRRAAQGVPPQDPVRRDLLVPGLLRARRRVGPGLAQDQGRAGRRGVGDQRPEGVDHPGPVRRLHLPVGAHRSRRGQARGDLVPARAHAPGRRRGPTHQADRRVRRVQRGLLLQRPRTARQRRRRGEQRVEGGHDHARVRARHVRHDQPPTVPEGARAHRRPGPEEREGRRSSRTAGPGPGVEQGQDHGDQRAAEPDVGPPGRRLHRSPGRHQQDVLVRVPPGGDAAGHRHPRHGRTGPPRIGGRRVRYHD